MLDALTESDVALSADQLRAKAIMGENFISPATFEKALRGKVSFTPADLAAFATVPWTDVELVEELAHGAFLFPAHTSVSLPWLRDLFGTSRNCQPCFNKDCIRWLGADGNPFRDRSLPVGWRLVRTEFEPYSTSMSWIDQEELVSDTHDRTIAIEVGLLYLVVYQTRNKKRVHKDKNGCIWCSDETAGGGRVCVGFGEDGLCVDAFSPIARWFVSLALLLSRKPSTT